MYATLGISLTDPNVSAYDVEPNVGGYTLDLASLSSTATVCEFANLAPALTLGCNAHHCNIKAAHSQLRPPPVPRWRELT